MKSVTLTADAAAGWGDSVYAEEVFAAPEAAAHTLELIPTPGREGSFVVLGILVS